MRASTHNITHGVDVTASVGIAALGEALDDHIAAIAAADAAMYETKRAGGDNVRRAATGRRPDPEPGCTVD